MKHLWASVPLFRRADALCTFLSMLTMSLPVCGLEAGSSVVGVNETECEGSFPTFLIFVVSIFLYYYLYFVCSVTFCLL